MGFDVNFGNKPIIKESQAAHDGGAGNLGYFESDEKKEQAKKNKSIFEEKQDSFDKHSDITDNSEEFSISKLIAQVILAIKDFFRKIFK